MPISSRAQEPEKRSSNSSVSRSYGVRACQGCGTAAAKLLISIEDKAGRTTAKDVASCSFCPRCPAKKGAGDRLLPVFLGDIRRGNGADARITDELIRICAEEGWGYVCEDPNDPTVMLPTFMKHMGAEKAELQERLRLAITKGMSTPSFSTMRVGIERQINDD